MRAVVDELLAQPTVHRVAREADVPGALQAMGVRPAAESAPPSDILNVHRIEGDVDYFYFYNPGAETAAVTVSFAVESQPYQLDAWTGEIDPIAVYARPEGRTDVPLRLAPEETTIIALTTGGRLHHEPTGPFATRTEAGGVRFDADGGLLVRAREPGTYTTTLSTGETIAAAIASVPAAQTLVKWHLSVEDWQPGPTATKTARIPHEIDLDALAPWTEIPGLADVSGIGRYRTSVTLGSGWTGGHGADLDLGTVVDTFRVTVNGQKLPPVDPIHPVVDIGPYLRAGENSIEVEVATTLNNRLRVVIPGVFGKQPRQAYGLMGPVRLIPYGEVRAKTSAGASP